jgi:excisionase family DNA binding protein
MKLIDAYIDAKQAAEELGVTRDEVYRLVRSKRLRHHRIGANGGILRFRREDLKNYLESCAVNPAPDRSRGKTKLKHLKG